MKKEYNVEGMHCNSCETLIEKQLKKLPGVDIVSASYKNEKLEVEFDSTRTSEKEIISELDSLGYKAVEIVETPKPRLLKLDSDKIGWIFLILSSIFVLFLIYYIATSYFDVEIPTLDEKTSLLLLFFVGILTGFHCVSMCGGFVLSYTTKNAIKGHKGFKQHLVYGGSKLFSYALIGGIFGLIGGFIAFSIQMRGIIAILAGIFMVFYAMAMFGFKFFKRFQFNPKFLTKISSKGYESEGVYKRPFLIGLLSGLFIACGPLQAMYLYAIGTGNFFQGLFSLGVFGLGTLPVMLGFGSITTVISHKSTKKILKISAVIVLILGIMMINRGLALTGNVNLETIKNGVFKPESTGAVIKDGVQEINMEVNRYGWTPDSFVLKKGVPVKWNIDVKELTGCNNEIIVNDYNIDVRLKRGLNVVEFTPTKEGTVRWSCWMGMIPGSFIVTETGEASQQQIQEVQAQTQQSAGSCGMGGSCGCGG